MSPASLSSSAAANIPDQGPFVDRPFLSGWDDLEVVTERLGSALGEARGSGTSSTRIESAACASLADHSGSGDLKVLTVTLNESSTKNDEI